MIKLTKHLEEKKQIAMNIISNVTSVRNENLEATLDKIIAEFEETSKKTNRIP